MNPLSDETHKEVDQAQQKLYEFDHLLLKESMKGESLPVTVNTSVTYGINRRSRHITAHVILNYDGTWTFAPYGS